MRIESKRDDEISSNLLARTTLKGINGKYVMVVCLVESDTGAGIWKKEITGVPSKSQIF